MPPTNRESALLDLQRLPAIGPKSAADLFAIGIRSVAEFARHDPEDVFAWLTGYARGRQNRVMLYALRCASYWACNDQHDPDLLRWQSWSDRALIQRGTPTKP